jgi:hypothetical protein
MHSIRGRLRGLAKAERGVFVKNPDTAVQERPRLVFEVFLKVRTVTKAMRVLNDRGTACFRPGKICGSNVHPGRLPEHASS